MAKRYQHHKFPPCLGYPKHEGKDEENLTHFFGHYLGDILITPADVLIALADTIRETAAMLSLILPCLEGKEWKNKKFSAIWDFWRVATITSKGRFYAESRRWH